MLHQKISRLSFEISLNLFSKHKPPFQKFFSKGGFFERLFIGEQLKKESFIRQKFLKRCSVKSNTLQFDFCIFYSSNINLNKTKKPSHRQHQSAGALLSLLQMMSYVTALKFKISKAYCFLIPHHLKHSPRTVSTKVRSAIIFS